MSLPLSHFLLEAHAKHEGGAVIVYECMWTRPHETSAFSYRVLCYGHMGDLYKMQEFKVGDHGDDETAARDAARKFAKAEATAI